MPKANKRKIAKRKQPGPMKLGRVSRFSSLRSLIAIGAVAVVGGVVLFFAHAATTDSYQTFLCPIRQTDAAGGGNAQLSMGDLQHYDFTGGAADINDGPGADRPGRRHLGVDITNHGHQAVQAVVNGHIIIAGSKAGYGGTIVLREDGYDATNIFRHQNVHEFLYGHLNNIYVHEGDSVKAGQELGTIGIQGDGVDKTGNEVGSALHWETWTPNEVFVDSLSKPRTQSNFGDSTSSLKGGGYQSYSGPWTDPSYLNFEPLTFLKICENKNTPAINILRSDPRSDPYTNFRIKATFYIDGVKHVSNYSSPASLDRILNFNFDAHNGVCESSPCSSSHGYWQGNFFNQSTARPYYLNCTPFGTTCLSSMAKIGNVDGRKITNMTLEVDFVVDDTVHHASTTLFTNGDYWNRTWNICLNAQNSTKVAYAGSYYYEAHLGAPCVRY